MTFIGSSDGLGENEWWIYLCPSMVSRRLQTHTRKHEDRRRGDDTRSSWNEGNGWVFTESRAIQPEPGASAAILRKVGARYKS
jgi:hypothetical protein